MNISVDSKGLYHPYLLKSFIMIMTDAGTYGTSSKIEAVTIKATALQLGTDRYR